MRRLGFAPIRYRRLPFWAWGTVSQEFEHQLRRGLDEDEEIEGAFCDLRTYALTSHRRSPGSAGVAVDV
jgi:hypothetical protein